MPPKKNIISRLLRHNKTQNANQRKEDRYDLSKAQKGDVIHYSDPDPERDDPFLVVQSTRRYTGPGFEWNAIVASNSQRTVSLEASDSENIPIITVNRGDGPFSLEALDIKENELITLDEEHTTKNRLLVKGTNYYYRNSFEAFQHPNDGGSENSFYMWDFIADDGAAAMAILKPEASPFQVYFSNIIDPEEIDLYPNERKPTPTR